MESAVDSRMGAWALLCLQFHQLHQTNLVWFHPLWLYEQNRSASVRAYYQVLNLGSWSKGLGHH